MLSRINTKILLSCLLSGTIIPAEPSKKVSIKEEVRNNTITLNKNNCTITPLNFVSEPFNFVSEPSKCGLLLLFLEHNHTDSLFFHSDPFDPISSTVWDTEKVSILHIIFEDNNRMEIDVNKIRWSGKFLNEYLNTGS